MIIKNIKDSSELKNHILSGIPTLYVGSQTSTVIPYEKIESKMTLGNLSSLKPEMELTKEHLKITGSVNWKDAKAFCQSQGRKIMTSPTEELALCLSGIATSATGERCFKFGTLREQVLEINYLDHQAVEKKLSSHKDLIDHPLFQNPKNKEILLQYQSEYARYRTFKNAPFPRLVKETDLMVGTEGQLGVITSALFKTTPANQEMYIFIKLPRWEESFESHLEIFQKVQNFRNEIDSCEHIDANSLSYLPKEDRPCENQDLIFLEVDQNKIEYLYENLILKLETVNQDQIFEMSSTKCRELRMNVPRYIFEKNQQMGVVKMGTDVQVTSENFEELLNFYKQWKNQGVAYNLFGHFGDAHLHFNFMPSPEDVNLCQSLLEELYQFVSQIHGSPFAEHGIGVVKKKFIKNYYSKSQYQIFSLLKQNMDPKNIFFPEGFMSMESI